MIFLFIMPLDVPMAGPIMVRAFPLSGDCGKAFCEQDGITKKSRAKLFLVPSYFRNGFTTGYSTFSKNKKFPDRL